MLVHYEKKGRQFTKKERLAIMDAALGAYAAGDRKKYSELSNQLPVVPRIANAWKKVYGAKFLVELGVNLDDVLEEYGEDWFND